MFEKIIIILILAIVVFGDQVKIKRQDKLIDEQSKALIMAAETLTASGEYIDEHSKILKRQNLLIELQETRIEILDKENKKFKKWGSFDFKE